MLDSVRYIPDRSKSGRPSPCRRSTTRTQSPTSRYGKAWGVLDSVMHTLDRNFRGAGGKVRGRDDGTVAQDQIGLKSGSRRVASTTGACRRFSKRRRNCSLAGAGVGPGVTDPPNLLVCPLPPLSAPPIAAMTDKLLLLYVGVPRAPGTRTRRDELAASSRAHAGLRREVEGRGSGVFKMYACVQFRSSPMGTWLFY